MGQFFDGHSAVFHVLKKASCGGLVRNENKSIELIIWGNWNARDHGQSFWALTIPETHPYTVSADMGQQILYINI